MKLNNTAQSKNVIGAVDFGAVAEADFKAQAAAALADVLGALTTAEATGAVTTTDLIIAYIKQLVTNSEAVKAVLGAINTAAATGTVTDTDLMMAYIKQLVTELQAVDTVVDAIPTTAMRGTDNAALASVLGALNDAAATGVVTDVDTLMAYMKQVVTDVEAINAIVGAAQALSAANDTVSQGFYAATTLSAVDADLAAGNIKDGVTIFGKVGTFSHTATPITAATVKTGLVGFANGDTITGTGTKTLSAANDTVDAGYYEATTLSAVDADLAVGNIKSGATIFGFAGAATVQDIADADLAITEAPTGKKFYSVTGGVKTGTGTKTLAAANDTVEAGYYEATTLSAVDTDLATGNIKAGVTIFGVAGKTEVVDTTEAGVPVIAARMKTDDIAFVNGSKITGTGTKTLAAANDTVAAGYYEATTLSAVDADLAVGNIATGKTIFGFAGTYDTSVSPITAATVATGLEGWVNGALVTGSGTKTLSDANDTVAAGYYEATTLHAVDSDLATANIKAGVTIFGIAGKTEVVDTTEATNPVVAGEMKTGQIGFVNGSKITGNGTQTLSDANDTVAAGYYAATTLHAVDSDLATGNIKAGVTIFGISGKTEVVDVSDTTAVAADVAAGKYFYTAAGVKTEGTAV